MGPSCCINVGLPELNAHSDSLKENRLYFMALFAAAASASANEHASNQQQESEQPQSSGATISDSAFLGILIGGFILLMCMVGGLHIWRKRRSCDRRNPVIPTPIPVGVISEAAGLSTSTSNNVIPADIFPEVASIYEPQHSHDASSTPNAMTVGQILTAVPISQHTSIVFSQRPSV